MGEDIGEGLMAGLMDQSRLSKETLSTIISQDHHCDMHAVSNFTDRFKHEI